MKQKFMHFFIKILNKQTKVSTKFDYSGIPKVFGAATEGDYNYLVMELLGKSIEDLFA